MFSLSVETGRGDRIEIKTATIMGPAAVLPGKNARDAPIVAVLIISGMPTSLEAVDGLLSLRRTVMDRHLHRTAMARAS